MLNVGVGFMVFGAMLFAIDSFYMLSARKHLKVIATIVGYKQFPSDKIITNNDIFRGRNFTWLRVMEFRDPTTGNMLQMYSNPGVANPEQIGTTLTIGFNPNKSDPIQDFVWVHRGFTSTRAISKLSFITGLILFVALLFVPRSSILPLVAAIIGFSVIFISAYIHVWHRPNQG